MKYFILSVLCLSFVALNLNAQGLKNSHVHVYRSNSLDRTNDPTALLNRDFANLHTSGDLFLQESAKLDEMIRRNKLNSKKKVYITKKRQDEDEDKPKVIHAKPHNGGFKNKTLGTNMTHAGNHTKKPVEIEKVDSENEENHKESAAIIKKNETTLENMSEQTEYILNEICNNAHSLSRSLNHILDNLKVVKDKILRLHTQKFSKQRLYTKFTRIANLLNINISEIFRVGSMIDILKASNCENLQELATKFKEIKVIPKKLRDMLESELKKSGIKMGLIVLN
jgi:hypothetical protein